MKKALCVIIRIAAVLLAFSLLTMLFMPKYIEKNVDGRVTAEYYREKVNSDVIFLGSSTVHAGVSPMTLYKELGMTSFDRSNSSQVMSLSYYLAEESIKRNKPELIVCDIGFAYQDINYVDEGSSRKSLDSMKWSKSKSDAIIAMMDETEHYLDYVFPILRFHSRWNDLWMEDLRYWIYKPTITHNGQLLEFLEMSKDTIYNPYMLEEGTLICDENMAYIQRLCDLCKDNDVQLLLIKMPMYEGNFCNSINDQIEDLASQNGVLYHNFQNDFDDIEFTMEDFTDGQHLNSFGAEKYSKYLGTFIKNNFELKDYSTDSNVKSVYDKKYERYEYSMNNRIPTEIIEAE